MRHLGIVSVLGLFQILSACDKSLIHCDDRIRLKATWETPFGHEPREAVIDTTFNDSAGDDADLTKADRSVRTVTRFRSARWTQSPPRVTVTRFRSVSWTQTPARHSLISFRDNALGRPGGHRRHILERDFPRAHRQQCSMTRESISHVPARHMRETASTAQLRALRRVDGGVLPAYQTALTEDALVNAGPVCMPRPITLVIARLPDDGARSALVQGSQVGPVTLPPAADFGVDEDDDTQRFEGRKTTHPVQTHRQTLTAQEQHVR